MQHILLPLLMLTVLGSCGGPATKNESVGSNDGSGLSPECTQFLDGYEKYVDDYIQLLKDYKSNPTDISLLERTTTMASEANTWGSKASPECKDVTEFMTRQAKVQAKLSTAALTL